MAPTASAGRHPGWRWAGLIVLFAGFPPLWLTFFSLIDRGPALDMQFAVSQVEYAISNAAQPAGISSSWQATELPSAVWSEVAPFASVWYRFPLRAADLPADPALYMAPPNANVNVFFDEIRLFSTGDNELPLVYYRDPVLVGFDRALVAERQRPMVYVNVTREAAGLSIGPIYMGPRINLQAEFRRVQLVARDVPRTIALFLLGIVLLLVVLAIMDRSEKAFPWLAATLVLWASHTLALQISDIPIALWSWFTIVYLLNGWVITVVIAFHRFYRFQSNVPLIALAAIAAPLAIGMFFVGMSGDEQWIRWYGGYVWVGFIMACALFTLCQHGVAISRRADFETLGLMLHGYTAMVIGTRDYLFDIGWPGIPGTFAYLPIYGAFSILFFVLLLARRFVRYQQRALEFNAELERQVAQVSTELESNFAALSASEQKQAVSEERMRITRDMHDGLGGQLVHALQLSGKNDTGAKERLHNTLRSALQDLRIIIDSMSPNEEDLIALLASFRHRIQGQLEDNGIALKWEMDDVPPLILGPEKALHLLRILQEILTNTITHARASRICLRTRAREDGVRIEVTDDGCGFDVQKVTRRGLRNIEERALALGADLSVRSGPAGTCVAIGVKGSPPPRYR